ncbi:receptor-like protein Cf-9 homolog [Camellia sinensis]|uniref:receptor-like protein Cf-9 homolog n=1 Tax=Camellia sinensis TaxID=4442 RepID=UPI0010359969|nr:receptor-like protein Cf-9 homolog [Camellia sinensis]
MGIWIYVDFPYQRNARSYSHCHIRQRSTKMRIQKGKLPYFNVISSLQFLVLSDISFSSQLHESISNPKALNSLYLFNCNLSGSILASLWNLTQITNLDFGYNSFSGQIPSSISNLAKLNDLYLSGNNLNGQIPDSLGNMSQLTSLYLSGNNLNGQIPDSLSNMSQLTSLYLRYNSLNGTIPSSLFALPSLVGIGLSNNKLQGPIPGLVYELQNLTYLLLSSNDLSGVVDLDKLLKVKNLIYLDLAYNGLSLSINNSVNSTLTNFHTIGLASCNLSEFPNFLREQASLYSLDLANNKMVVQCTSKTKGKHPFPKLRIIDISCNEFTGLLPTNYIKQFGAMMNVDEHEMKLKYMGDSYYQDSVVIILKSIGRLNSLRGLHLSHNNLEGHIPTSLGNLKNLESLDLSSNKFVGEIPQQLKSLTFLEVLNLSDNQLAGPIPQGSQFNTFGSDSYGGNLALCGLPLSNKCKELLSLPPPPTLQQDENSGKSSGFNWQVVMLGYGCGFLFGMIMGYLMFVTRRPEWLKKIVEGKHHKNVKRSKKGAH